MSTTQPLPSGLAVHCRFSQLVDHRSLLPFPKNPNTHSEEQVRLLTKIIRQSGWRNPIVVSSRSGYVTKGHGRLLAAARIFAETGEALVPVEFQEYANREEEYQDIIADNRISELSTLDSVAVQELLSEVKSSIGGDLFDVEFFGFRDVDFQIPISEWDNPKNDPDKAGSTDKPCASTLRIQVPPEAAKELRAAIMEILPRFPEAKIL